MIKKTEKIMISAFIDSQNLNLGIKSQGWKLDWRKFRQYLRNKYKVTEAYLLAPNKYYSRLYKPFSSFIIRMDWLKESLKFGQKKTGISGRSKP